MSASSAVGTLRIVLEPIPGGSLVALTTAEGIFRGTDHWITVEPILLTA